MASYYTTTTASADTSTYVYYSPAYHTTACYIDYGWSTNTTAATWTAMPTSFNVKFTPIYYEAPQETAEEKRARLERQRVAEEQRMERERLAEQERKELEKQRATAEEVAQRLIADVFGEERLQEYKSTKSLTVDSPEKPGRRYVVTANRGIKVYEGDKHVDSLCIHFHDGQGHADTRWLPDADVVFGKAFLALNDEERLLKVANHTPRRVA